MNVGGSAVTKWEEVGVLLGCHGGECFGSDGVELM